MRKLFLIASLIAVSVTAQNLTPAQKEADFRYLASLFSTYYAPAQWKKTLLNVDVMDLKPWLEKVSKTTTDLDYYEVCVDYVAALQDTHSSFQLPSDFVARLGFTADLYDGSLLIDSLNRTLLPAKDYPFTGGDELVSIDGVDAKQLLEAFMKYAPEGNPTSSRRLAAARLTIRPQYVMPHAADVGDSAVVVIKRQSGASETYTIPWSKTGTPVTVGPVPSPKTSAAMASRVRGPVMSDEDPDYMKPLRELQFSGVLRADDLGLNGYGSRSPVFLGGLPSTFTRRLGGSSADFYYSGVFKRDELTIGYIRIPNYSPSSSTQQLRVFDQEIAYMKANTQGLIIDEMRNTGGSLCFGEDIMTRLVPYPFLGTGFSTKPYWSRVNSFYNAMISAKAANASPDVIQQYELLYQEMAAANHENRLTIPLPLCTSSLLRQPSKDINGIVLAYDKPILMLTDEFSTSTADSVAGMFQDADRGVIYGNRTNGAGGNNTSFDAGVFSEAVTGMTLALQVRSRKLGRRGLPGDELHRECRRGAEHCRRLYDQGQPAPLRGRLCEQRPRSHGGLRPLQAVTRGEPPAGAAGGSRRLWQTIGAWTG